MASSHHLLPHSLSSFLPPPTPLPKTHFPPPFLSPKKPTFTTPFTTFAKKKNPWLDPFDDGEDPNMEYTSLFAGGKQDEDPRPPDNPDNPYGFLKFPMGYNVELDSLASKVRGDVRRCCCVVAGGVYENLLFFPTIQLIKDRYPGVEVDVIAAARGKQTYELNKNVRWADAYDPDEDFPDPMEYTDMIGLLKNRYYDLVLSTKLAGLGHAAFLFMTSARDKISYVYPNVNAAGAGLFLTETFTAPSLNLSECGYNMYSEMNVWLGRPARNVPQQPVPPLKVSISKKLRAYVEEKYTKAGVEKGKYIVIHGIKSDSVASMRSKGDTDSILPIQFWAEIAKDISNMGLKPLFVIPHEKEREDVEEIVGEDPSILFITTPGQVLPTLHKHSAISLFWFYEYELKLHHLLAQLLCHQLAALINDSAGVICTNTAAVQLANARDKPSVALFSSEEKGKIFVPNAEEKNCVIISSRTGRLIDVDVEAAKNAVKMFERSPVFA